ncbi:MAG: hypothetical protein AAF228_12545 [Pseudomonadota bacterium]
MSYFGGLIFRMVLGNLSSFSMVAIVLTGLTAYSGYIYMKGRSHGYENAETKYTKKIAAIKDSLLAREQEFNQLLKEADDEANKIPDTPITPADLIRLCKRDKSCRDNR